MPELHTTVEEMQNAPSMMQRALNKHGITADSLALKLKEELEACEVKCFNDRENGITYSKNLVAWDVRQRARMDAQKLLGSYPVEKHEVDHKGGGILIIERTGSAKRDEPGPTGT